MRRSIEYCLKQVLFASIGTMLLAVAPGAAFAASTAGPDSIVTVLTAYDFQTLVGRLESAVTKNDMAVVAKASASAGAEKRGVKILGDAVVMVFRNDFAVRMLAAKSEAGLDAPIPIHVMEAADGSTRISYRPPSAVFRAYHAKALDDMARELDPIFQRIVTQAAAK